MVGMESMAIHLMTQADLQDLQAMGNVSFREKTLNYFQARFERQMKGMEEVFIITIDGIAAGYCVLNLQPKYNVYKRLGIPEIQDLNILPQFRRRGAGRKIVEFCEKRALEKGFEQIGISFGLHSSYGAAQRLYVKMGYIPDGFGVTYDRAPVGAGEIRAVDDDLCLMMIKDLR